MKYLFIMLLTQQACKKAGGSTEKPDVHVTQTTPTCAKIDPAAQSWETYSPNGGNQIFRLRVPCGWLVKVNSANTSNPIFVPDMNTDWVGENYLENQQ
jgi:hypothetical protein